MGHLCPHLQVWQKIKDSLRLNRDAAKKWESNLSAEDHLRSMSREEM